MNAFTYQYPVTVYFGEGTAAKNLPSELAKVGGTVMLAYGGGSIKKYGIYDELIEILKIAGKEIVEFSGIMSNPTYAKVQEGAALAREKHVDFILAVGGGSVIDCCKIISAQALLDEDIWELEYAKHGAPTAFIPMGAIVTAFGTGAEMNNGAVITNEDKMQKAALWGAFASFAALDPVYTMTMPMKQVISGSFDTLSHCMETYFGMGGANNLSDEINETIMKSVIRHIRETVKDPADKYARSELIWASAMAENGILKIGKVTDFQCHMIEHQLGAYTDCNHGQGLAVIHPVLYRHIYKSAPERFARFAKNVWGKNTAEEGVDALADFIKEIGLPTTFSEMNIPTDTDFRAIAQSTVITPGCCKRLTADEIYEILTECQ
ncbi:MAG: iron-containing alcohol dehydrogenase [Clostridia bacterium]|nr:iron-containing alcohol dehydrogenase [Clostridia bacterium]